MHTIIVHINLSGNDLPLHVRCLSLIYFRYALDYKQSLERFSISNIIVEIEQSKENDLEIIYNNGNEYTSLTNVINDIKCPNDKTRTSFRKFLKSSLRKSLVRNIM